MPVSYAGTSTIAAPPDRVWALLTDAASYPTWNPTVVKIDGTIAAGQKIKLVSTLDPKRTFKLKVAEIDAPRRMVWSSGMPLGLFTGRRTFTLTPRTDGGTDFVDGGGVQRADGADDHQGDPGHDRVVRRVRRGPQEGRRGIMSR